jgi:hypothetical protein
LQKEEGPSRDYMCQTRNIFFFKKRHLCKKKRDLPETTFAKQRLQALYNCPDPPSIVSVHGFNFFFYDFFNNSPDPPSIPSVYGEGLLRVYLVCWDYLTLNEIHHPQRLCMGKGELNPKPSSLNPKRSGLKPKP